MNLLLKHGAPIHGKDRTGQTLSIMFLGGETFVLCI